IRDPLVTGVQTCALPISREKLRDVQAKKLRELLRLLFARNRFYTGKWREAGVAPDELRSLADLRKLPFTYKSELVRAQDEAPPLDRKSTRLNSSHEWISY